MFLQIELRGHVVPATVVVADAIVFGQSRNERTEAHRLVVVERAAVGVLIEEKHGLRVFLTGFEKAGLALELGNGVGIEMVNAATPADSEESAIAVRHLHQVGKEVPAARLGHRAQVAGIAEGPELLSVVPA